ITGYIDEGNGSYNNILVIKYNAETGDTIWTAQFNGESNGNDMGYNIAPDNDGNVYVVGTVWNANRDYEIAILKYNSNGTLLWNVITSGDNIQAEDKGLDLVIDNYGNIYLAGFCTSNDNYTDIITQKYNSSGTLLWSRKEDGDDNLNAKGSAITINSSGIYVLGYVTSAQNGTDIALLKYNSDGELQLTRQYNGSGNAEDKAFGIIADDSYIYIGGYITATGSTDCITLKYGNDGTLIWARSFNGEAGEEDKAFGIVAD